MEEFLNLAKNFHHKKDLTTLLEREKFLHETEVNNLTFFSNVPRKFENSKYCETQKYIPGKKFYTPVFKPSKIKHTQRLECFNALKTMQSGKCIDNLTSTEKIHVKFYNEMQNLIQNENIQFLNHTKEKWNLKLEKPVKKVKTRVNFALDRWNKNVLLAKNYPRYYKELSTLNLHTDENEQQNVSYQHLQNVLELGAMGNFLRPTLMRKFRFKSYPEEESISSSTLPISQDTNISDILKNHRVHVAISSSALKQLSDRDSRNSWQIPVVIKELDVIDDSGVQIKQKVVFIDKALPKTNPTTFDFDVCALKRLIQTSLCDRLGFEFDNKVESEANQSKTTKIYQNAIYRLWKISKSLTSSILLKQKQKNFEIQLLVRSKTHGCEMTSQGVLQPVIITPKIEQQIQFGANIPTKSELIREWIDLFFRPFSVLYRLRIDAKLPEELIAIEPCLMQKINNQAQHLYNMKISTNLNLFAVIFDDLMDLECGNYLLRHSTKNEGFLSIFKETDESDSKSFDLHQEYTDCKPDFKAHPNYVPIDCTYILPAQEELKHHPGLFQGVGPNKKKRNAKNKNAKLKQTRNVRNSDQEHMKVEEVEEAPKMQT